MVMVPKVVDCYYYYCSYYLTVITTLIIICCSCRRKNAGGGGLGSSIKGLWNELLHGFHAPRPCLQSHLRDDTTYDKHIFIFDEKVDEHLALYWPLVSWE